MQIFSQEIISILEHPLYFLGNRLKSFPVSQEVFPQKIFFPGNIV